ncbi:MAG: Double zinc ribbon [Candidatus Methanomethylophilaceae archaeon]|nr:Double zinc ribbon [Candidatus Methanomethylophilaceae archaeon]
MEQEGDLGFCPGCGAEVDMNAKYCRACGKPLVEEAVVETKTRQKGKRSRIAFIVMLLLGIFVVWIGAMILIDPQLYIDESLALLEDMGYDEAMVEALIMSMAYGMVGVGVMSLVAAVLAFTRRFWILAMILTVLVTLSGLMLLYPLIGVLAIYMLWKGRGEFIS